ncbi:hypothetical protein [Streptomyces parvulus]
MVDEAQLLRLLEVSRMRNVVLQVLPSDRPSAMPSWGRWCWWRGRTMSDWPSWRARSPAKRTVGRRG